jgi:hypothetical protein
MTHMVSGAGSDGLGSKQYDPCVTGMAKKTGSEVFTKAVARPRNPIREDPPDPSTRPLPYRDSRLKQALTEPNANAVDCRVFR